MSEEKEIGKLVPFVFLPHPLPLTRDVVPLIAHPDARIYPAKSSGHPSSSRDQGKKKKECVMTSKLV
jgi:hypothetical protein